MQVLHILCLCQHFQCITYVISKCVEQLFIGTYYKTVGDERVFLVETVFIRENRSPALRGPCRLLFFWLQDIFSPVSYALCCDVSSCELQESCQSLHKGRIQQFKALEHTNFYDKFKQRSRILCALFDLWHFLPQDTWSIL